jgi:hypothetical protein
MSAIAGAERAPGASIAQARCLAARCSSRTVSLPLQLRDGAHARAEDTRCSRAVRRRADPRPTLALQAGVARDVARLRKIGSGSGLSVLRGAASVAL